MPKWHKNKGDFFCNRRHGLRTKGLNI
jgi:hypothetical protein